MNGDYAARVQQQVKQFSDPSVLSKLPSIYHYWSAKFLGPRIRDVFGVPSIFDVYFAEAKRVAELCRKSSSVAAIYGIGSGDCQTELRLTERLQKSGIDNFKIVCLELSPVRLARARRAAQAKGLERFLEFVETDINSWKASEGVDLYLIHHSLHHISALEHLFDAMEESMHRHSGIATADMIGRNGHKRWPETRRWIDYLWQIMPGRYRFNFQFRAEHKEYLDWDCSRSGFEGIRAQDILPLLVRRFEFSAFLGCGGVIDPFIERGYGHNLDNNNAADSAFVDFVEELNQTLLEAGLIKPTMMFATLRKESVRCSHYRGLSPEYCVRVPTE